MTSCPIGDTRVSTAVRIVSLADVRPAAEALQTIVARMGAFRAVVSHNIASREPMVDAAGDILAETVFGFVDPAEHWWTHAGLALQSPLARACRYEDEPFWANAGGIRTRAPNPYLDAISLMNFEQRALMKAAIVIPIHLPFGRIGIAAFGPTDDRTDLSAEFEQHADTLMVLSRSFVSGYVKATRRRRWLPADCYLTRREVECLNWAAAGKTDAEIGRILGLAHSTVRFHLKNAGAKLDSINRGQTMLKAVQLGYLGQVS